MKIHVVQPGKKPPCYRAGDLVQAASGTLFILVTKKPSGIWGVLRLPHMGSVAAAEYSTLEERLFDKFDGSVTICN